MNASQFTPAALSQYLDDNGGICAATADFHADELRRLRQLYATLRSLYHQVQQAETEGAHSLTLESLTQTVKLDLRLCGVELFPAILEPLINKLNKLERIIVEMTADMPQRQAEYSPTPELEAVSALCLPQPTRILAPDAPQAA
mgnify:CR=1 FL=1